MQKLTFLLVIVFFSSLTNANDKTYERCSLEWWEGFNYLHYYVSEVPIKKAKKLAKTPKSVVAAYKLSEVYGVDFFYLSGHIEYKKCTLSVNDNVQLSFTESKYRNCSFQSVTRTNILEYINKGKSEQEIVAKLSEQHHDLATSLHSKAKYESYVAALNFSGNLLVECVDNIQSE